MLPISLADNFYDRNRSLVDGLVTELKAAGLNESDLDELVHDSAANGGFESEDASSLNNQGMELQVAFILEGDGIEAGSTMLRGLCAPKP